jgi:cytoskeleton protein RodZ
VLKLTAPLPAQIQEVRSAPGTLPAETWPAPRHEASPSPPPTVVAVPAPPPPVVMSMPSVGQAQAAQPPSIEVTRPAPPAAADPQEAVVRATPALDVTAAPSLPMKADTPVTVQTNSWVELRAPNGDILAQSYVRAGESYTVPAGISYRIIDAR